MANTRHHFRAIEVIDMALQMLLEFQDVLSKWSDDEGRAASPKLRHVKFEDHSFPSTLVPDKSFTILPPSWSYLNVQASG